MMHTTKKKVRITIKMTLNELAELDSMLTMLEREVLSKMPGDPQTYKHQNLVREVHDILEEASR